MLYAPTFSPSLTSAVDLKHEIIKLADSENLLLIKFHDLMNKKLIEEYQIICEKMPNIDILSDNNVIKYLILADLMISDTSSVVYEFLLLDKPVVTYKSNSKNIQWEDFSDPSFLTSLVKENLAIDKYKKDRNWIINNYHPYKDGLSSKRMVDVMEKYISANPIPLKRKIPWGRKRKMIKMFGKVK